MTQRIVDLAKLTEAQEAAETAMEAATLAVWKVAEAAAAVSASTKPKTVPLTFRAPVEIRNRLCKLAYETRVPIEKIIEEAVSRHLDPAQTKNGGKAA